MRDIAGIGSAPHISLGQYEKAIEYYTQALAIAREIGNRQGEGQRLGNLGSAYSSQGQLEKAIEYYIPRPWPLPVRLATGGGRATI